jgi:hypothetical protein
MERTEREAVQPERDIQVNCSVSAWDKFKARRMATPIGPREVIIRLEEGCPGHGGRE